MFINLSVFAISGLQLDVLSTAQGDYTSTRAVDSRFSFQGQLWKLIQSQKVVFKGNMLQL